PADRAAEVLQLHVEQGVRGVPGAAALADRIPGALGDREEVQAWRRRYSSSSPSARSRSSAYSRIVSSNPKRGTSGDPLRRTRLLSTSEARPDAVSPPSTASASSSVQPPANTASCASRACSGSARSA